MTAWNPRFWNGRARRFGSAESKAELIVLDARGVDASAGQDMIIIDCADLGDDFAE